MFSNDFSKMFDPSQYTQNMQKFFDMASTMSAGQQSMNTMKQVGTLLTDTITQCTEKQFKYAQSTMEDCIETMRELSTAKGMEDYMSKQTEISKRAAEKAQSVAQDIASQWQKTQAECTSLIGQQVSQTMEWSKSMGNSVANSVASATRNATNAASSSSK